MMCSVFALLCDMWCVESLICGLIIHTVTSGLMHGVIFGVVCDMNLL